MFGVHHLSRRQPLLGPMCVLDWALAFNIRLGGQHGKTNRPLLPRDPYHGPAFDQDCRRDGRGRHPIAVLVRTFRPARRVRGRAARDRDVRLLQAGPPQRTHQPALSFGQEVVDRFTNQRPVGAARLMSAMPIADICHAKKKDRPSAVSPTDALNRGASV